MIIDSQKIFKPIKVVRNIRNLPLIKVNETEEIGIDSWKQVDLVNAIESGLTVNVSVGEHTGNTSWDTTFWWHEVALVLEGEMIVKDKLNGAKYYGHDGDMFYFDHGSEATIGGTFKGYFIRTPIPWRVKNNNGITKAINLLQLENEVFLPGSPPESSRKHFDIEMKGKEFPDRGLIKFIKGATSVPLGKVQNLGVSLDENWLFAPLLEGVETDQLLSVSLDGHASTKMNFGHLHRWHQIVLFLEGEMINEVLDTGEVYKIRKGDFLYMAPGLTHRVGGDFWVFVFHMPPRWRHTITTGGYIAINSIMPLEDEAIHPGSDSDKS